MPSNAPFGFRPYRHLAGGDVGGSTEWTIATGYATTIYSGDPVKLLSDGTIAQAAAADRILGIFQGCSYTDANGAQQFSSFWPASTTATNIKAEVCTDPFVTYEVQSGGTPAQTNVGNCADHVVGTGNSTVGTSGGYLNSTMGTAIKGFRVLGIINKPGNSGQYATLEVQLLQSELLYFGQGTVGV